MLCFVLINGVLLNLLCVWILTCCLERKGFATDVRSVKGVAASRLSKIYRSPVKDEGPLLRAVSRRVCV